MHEVKFFEVFTRQNLLNIYITVVINAVATIVSFHSSMKESLLPKYVCALL